MSKYYFIASEDEPENCYTLKYFKNKMKQEGIKEMEIVEAVPLYGTGWFYCNEYDEPGEVGNGDCGKACKAYKPRNGKNGRCVHSQHLYEPAGKTIKIFNL